MVKQFSERFRRDEVVKIQQMIGLMVGVMVAKELLNLTVLSLND